MVTPDPIWIATEFDTDDGGRAWMQAATNPDRAKGMCQYRHDTERQQDNLPTEQLTWAADPASEWLFGQSTETARTGETSWYEIRKVEVT